MLTANQLIGRPLGQSCIPSATAAAAAAAVQQTGTAWGRRLLIECLSGSPYCLLAGRQKKQPNRECLLRRRRVR